MAQVKTTKASLNLKHNKKLSALEVFINDMRYINPLFTYLLTYFTYLLSPRDRAMRRVN